MKQSTLAHFLRKANRNESGILSVAPMRGRYVWLNEELETPRRATITFEAKGSNDICLCLHSSSESTVIGREGFSEGSPVYEILFGGWSNSKSAIRKHGVQQNFVTKNDQEEAVIRSTTAFCSYWVTIYNDWIYAGVGELGSNEILRWQDPHPFATIKSIGLSSWNTPLQFKNILILDPFIPKIHTFNLNGQELYGNEMLSDGALHCLGETIPFPIHNAILYAWNSSFFAQEESNTEPQETKLVPISYDKPSTPDLTPNLTPDPLMKNDKKKPPMSIPNEDLWKSLPSSLIKIIFLFFYTGETRILSSEETILLMNFASNHSLQPLLEYLQSLTCCTGSPSKAPTKTIIKRVIQFSSLFRNPLFSDVTFLCDGDTPTSMKREIVAHRVILALWSEPFRAMFSCSMRESTENEIYLPEVSHREFKLFLEFCYYGMVSVPPASAVATLIIADRFGVTPLQEVCIDVVVKYIDIDNCCYLLEMACLYNWKILHTHCMRFIETNFETVMHLSPAFNELSCDTLLELILSDDLMVSSEYEVYRAFLSWSDHQFPNKKMITPEQQQLLIELICCVRFPLLSEKILQEEVSSYFLFERSQRFRDQLRFSLAYIKSTEDGSSDADFHLDNFIKRPRTVFNYHQLLFSHCGDTNGVCYYIGCNYGKNSIWQNPHKAKRVVVSLSSPPSRYTRAELLVTRTFSTTNYMTGNPPWCAIDLTEGHELICNRYTLRLDNSNSYLHNWLLQGSVDISNPDLWTTLRVHKDESMFIHKDWPVFGKSARFPYRFFRVVALPPHKVLAISSVELYGYFQ